MTAVDLTGMAVPCVRRIVDVTPTIVDGAPLASMTARVSGSEIRLVVPADTPASAEKLAAVSLIISN